MCEDYGLLIIFNCGLVVKRSDSVMQYASCVEMESLDCFVYCTSHGGPFRRHSRRSPQTATATQPNLNVRITSPAHNHDDMLYRHHRP